MLIIIFTESFQQSFEKRIKKYIWNIWKLYRNI